MSGTVLCHDVRTPCEVQAAPLTNPSPRAGQSADHLPPGHRPAGPGKRHSERTVRRYTLSWGIGLYVIMGYRPIRHHGVCLYVIMGYAYTSSWGMSIRHHGVGLYVIMGYVYTSSWGWPIRHHGVCLYVIMGLALRHHRV